MLKGVPLVIIGVLLVLLGLAGAVGLLDKSRFKLYEDHQNREPAAGNHRAYQRGGGVVMMAGGAAFIYAGLTN
ncbi:hypothetical protein Krad_2377 [Kineococcus radiotolerans SRS30216 = ATCC BAA-149]|uniref:Integral membrane protein n=2 Tax=Kineococcus radiotolerans TaxID=131568 RepID=A6WAL8_KINRD|nr:hypothetical protein Krad_2377 [Kineococcus radiotolerans SRS30216 = ATCC BAA-149]